MYYSGSDWYRYDPETLKDKLHTDYENGLDGKALASAKRDSPVNAVFPTDNKEYRLTGKNVILSVFSVLLSIMLIIDILVLKDNTAYFALAAAVLNFVVILLSYIFSGNVIDELEGYSVPEVRVRRGGKTLRIRLDRIVQGDIILLSSGDIVPCDGRIITCSSLRVLEMNISGGDGEKDADFIDINYGLDPSEQKNMLFARTVVSSGTAVMVACDTGEKTLAVRRGIGVGTGEKKAPEIARTLAGVARNLSVLMGGYVFAATFVTLLIKGANGLFDSFLLTLSVAAASMCELTVAIGYIAITCGLFFRIDRGDDFNTAVIIKNLGAIDKIRHMTCLFVPKSAGICENSLVIEKVYTNSRELTADPENTDKLRRSLYIAVSTFGGIEHHESRTTAVTDELEAFLRLTQSLGITADEVEKKMMPVDYRVNRGDRLFDTALTYYREKYLICVRGALQIVLSRCSGYTLNGTVYPLSGDMRNDITRLAAEYEKQSYRLVAAATKISKYNSLEKQGYSEDDLCFEGFFAMREPYSPDCADTVASLEDMNIKTLMFCDDISGQSVSLASNLGICTEPVNIISAPDFKSGNIRIIDLRMPTYRLFLGLGPRQKKYVLDKLREGGEHIGVIGQNLSDVSLMDGEDTVGFAANMTLSPQRKRRGAEITGARLRSNGSEVLKRIADAVILSADRKGRGGINSVYEAVLTCKMIYNNIYKILFYLIASNTCRALLAPVCVLSGTALVTPAQIMLSGALIDMLAVFVLVFTKNRQEASSVGDLFIEAKKKKMLGLYRACLAGAASAAVLFATSALANLITKDAVQSAVTVTAALMLVQTVCTWELARGRQKPASGTSGMLVIMLLCVIEYFALSAVFPSFFNSYITGSIGYPGVLLALIPSVITLCVCELLRFFKNRKQ